MIDEVVNEYRFDTPGSPTNHTYHHDALQSVVGLSGHAGTVEATLRYAAFGELIGQTGSNFSSLRFTGRELDTARGLYYYRARYYDSDLGRFLAEDPLGLDGGDTNLYAYAANNPLRFNDPTGTIIFELLLAGASIVLAGSVAVITASVALKGLDLSGQMSRVKYRESARGVDGTAAIVGGTALAAPSVVGGAALTTTFAIASPIFATEFVTGALVASIAPDYRQAKVPSPGSFLGSNAARFAAESISVLSTNSRADLSRSERLISLPSSGTSTTVFNVYCSPKCH